MLVDRNKTSNKIFRAVHGNQWSLGHSDFLRDQRDDGEGAECGNERFEPQLNSIPTFCSEPVANMRSNSLGFCPVCPSLEKSLCKILAWNKIPICFKHEVGEETGRF